MTKSPAVESIERAQAAALLVRVKDKQIISKSQLDLLTRIASEDEKKKAALAEEQTSGTARPHLTLAHQKHAAQRPRIRMPAGAARSARPDESIDEATLRLQQAKADTEELDADKRELELAVLKGSLVTAASVRDNLEAEHLRWVAELEQLPHSCAAALPDVAASLRDVMRAAIEAQCLAVRQRIAND